MVYLSPDALRLLRAIGEAGSTGFSRKQQSKLFSGNRTAAQLEAIRGELLREKLIEEVVIRPEGRGRPTSWCYLI